jgi:hypothetical protein
MVILVFGNFDIACQGMSNLSHNFALLESFKPENTRRNCFLITIKFSLRVNSKAKFSIWKTP